MRGIHGHGGRHRWCISHGVLAAACLATFANADGAPVAPVPESAPASAAGSSFPMRPPYPPGELWHGLLQVAKLDRHELDARHVERLLGLRFPPENHDPAAAVIEPGNPDFGGDWVEPGKTWYFSATLRFNDATRRDSNFTFTIAPDPRTGLMAVAPARAYCIDAEHAKADVAHAGWRFAGGGLSDVGLHGTRFGRLYADYLRGGRTLRLWYTPPPDATNAGECVGGLQIMQETVLHAPWGIGDLPMPTTARDALSNLGELLAMSAPLYHPFYATYLLQHTFSGNGIMVDSNTVPHEDVTVKTTFVAPGTDAPLTLRLRSTSPPLPVQELPAFDPTATVDIVALAPFSLALADAEAALRPSARWTTVPTKRQGPGGPLQESRTSIDNADETRGEIVVVSTAAGVVDEVHAVMRFAP